MGLSTSEIVALLGAHTVGRLTAANSGINGVWVKDSSASFSNRYFRGLIGVPWTKNTAQSNDVWQAGPNAPVPGVMLRSDVELVFNTTTASGAAACPSFNFNAGTSSGCPRQSATVASVQLFAGNQSAWHAAFSAAWTKMVEFNTYSLNSTTVSSSALPSPLVPASVFVRAAILVSAAADVSAGTGIRRRRCVEGPCCCHRWRVSRAASLRSRPRVFQEGGTGYLTAQVNARAFRVPGRLRNSLTSSHTSR
jgi:catalase (peroxidase I)